MSIEIKMPQLGLTMTEGLITRWFKAEGDTVVKGDPLYEVETDKLTNVMESETDGVLLKIVAEEGAEIPVLGLLAVIGAAGEDVNIGAAATAAAEAPVAETEIHVQDTIAAAVPPAEGNRIKASPLAKKIAAAKGVELSSLTGSGPGGRIVRRDVESAQAAPIAAPVTVSAISGEEQPDVRRERMGAMRRSISKNMTHSWTTAPVVHYNRGADITNLAELKNSLSAGKRKISYTDILTKLVANVLMEYPSVNAGVDGDDILYHDYVNMGIAVALEDGLIVPVIRNAHAKGVGAISDEIRDLAARAKGGGLTLDEMSGGTFTISNLGMFGMESFTPIINQPESAILGVNTIVRAPVEVDGEIIMRPKMTLSLTADHRIIDGAVAAQFLQEVCALIENPWRMLL